MFQFVLVNGPGEAERQRYERALEKTGAALRDRDTFPAGSPRRVQAEAAIRQAQAEWREADTHFLEVLDKTMTLFTAAMLKLGMVFPSSQPTFPPYQVPKREDFADDSTWEAAVSDYTIEWNRFCQPLLSAHPAGGSTIPLHKLLSSAGWIVTPDELRKSLDAYDAYALGAANGLEDPSGHLKEMFASDAWKYWIAYMRRAVGRGGMKVF